MNEIKRLVRSLRKKETPAEKKMWAKLRNRQFRGKKFLRQHPIPIIVDKQKRYYIADFYCKEERLVIELDGKIHEQQKEYDDYRTEVMNQLSLKVIRFENADVLEKLNEVLNALKKIITHPAPSSPSLSNIREGHEPH